MSDFQPLKDLGHPYRLAIGVRRKKLGLPVSQSLWHSVSHLLTAHVAAIFTDHVGCRTSLMVALHLVHN